MAGATVLKLGGELLEDAAAVRAAAQSILDLASRGRLVVVHGGGRAIDAELGARGVQPRFVDGLRITDTPTLDVVVSVLAGRTNTALVAAIAAAGGRAVGLTGADARIGLCAPAAPVRSLSGATVDLGLVGRPSDSADITLIADLLALGYVPVICSIGMDAGGALLNVNADTFAGHLAAALGARALIVAGTTEGVLDAAGRPIAELAAGEIDALLAAGTAHSGMVAKLAACRHALDAGAADVRIVSGRAGPGFAQAPGTRIVMRPDTIEQQLEINA